ncbi:hypothetical protein [Cohnella silvisoli]|uniref:Lipoprotein n=1 Tax=Cohnella silvisoli TaxID=2873699 RepID=A0ABV1KTB3_9BACL|nr:hypothetical protein [Cohnella silvisoli]MCD9021472.1 hypothetical protein [Cohnella silvisoli]
MKSVHLAKASLLLLFIQVALVSLVGCSASRMFDSTDPGSESIQPSQTALAAVSSSELPSDVPKDIRILEGAKDVTAIQTGDGVTKGDGFYQLSFRVRTSLEETAKLYRAMLIDKGYEFMDEPVEGSVSISGSTPTWVFYLTIAESTEFKGETSVTIAYTK